MKFGTDLVLDYFKIAQKSDNGSYFFVKAVKSGTTEIKSAFNNVVRADKSVRVLEPPIKGQQSIEIYNPIEMKPKLVAFPFDPITKNKYQYELKVTVKRMKLFFSDSLK